VIGSDQGIAQRHVDPLPPLGDIGCAASPRSSRPGAVQVSRRPTMTSSSTGCLSASAFARRCAARSGEVRRSSSSASPSGPAACSALYWPFWMVIPTHSRPSAVGIPTVRQPGPSSRRTVLRSGQKSGKGTKKVEDIEVLRRRQLREGPALTDRRITAVGADDQIRRELTRPLRAVGPHPDHAIPRKNHVPDRRPQAELE
jgi:hypothetical protein